MRPIKFYVVLAVISVLMIAAASFATGGGPLATITKIKGAPQIVKASTGKTSPAQIGETIEFGDTLVTDADSRATLIFNDGEIRVITSGSNVKFSEGDKPEQSTHVAKVATTLADAVNARNLEKTFESVTGAKLSMSGADKLKKGQAPQADLGGAAPSAGTPPQMEKIDDSARPELKEAQAGAANEAVAAAGDEAKMTEAAAPVPPPPPVTSAPAVKSSAVTPELEAQASSAPARPAQHPEAAAGFDDAETSRAKAERKPMPKAAPREPQTAGAKQWGYWFDDDNSASWDLLLPASVLANAEKLMFKTASSTQDIKNTRSRVMVSEPGEGSLTLVLVIKTKKGDMSSLRAELKVDNAARALAAEEIRAIENLRAEDLETYLYVKSSILKKHKFYLAALAALDELEKLQPRAKMPHALKSKAIIYHEMGELELMQAAVDALKK